MKVLLAGYNLDREVIEELKKKAPQRQDVTPETLSASYARISRDPRPVDRLRSVARAEVEKARRSNRNIIFKMGHHSVAEHAVFNFDILGISRVATEELEKFRLCSYTEKSQRYQTLTDDFIIPAEIRKAGQQRIFVDTIKAQNSLYHEFYVQLEPHFQKKNPALAQDPEKHSLLEGWAKEDARYVVSLATEGQLGLTLNARNLELLIRRFASKQLEEIKELNRQIYSLAKEVAPSIVLFTDGTDFDLRTYPELEKASDILLKKSPEKEEELVRLVDHTPEADTRVIASLLHTSSSLPYEACLDKARNLKPREKKEFLKIAFKHMEFYDPTLREFEYVSLTFDLIVTASCFAQLKRHRMATLTSQRYNPGLGVTVPPSIEEIGAREDFMRMVERTNDVYSRLKREVGQAADYVLMNAHRRRILLKVNARELYHISRLREDSSAQWEIRSIAKRMSDLASEVMPLTFLLLGGKDVYPECYKRLFAKYPKSFPAGS
ncbi:MAG: thymidylate synthase (FAD) [Candidatus Aminicenantes bacterium]|nr:thymidylate synthase (FAD) [Candidatus Aminicenantes bacterium]